MKLAKPNGNPSPEAEQNAAFAQDLAKALGVKKTESFPEVLTPMEIRAPEIGRWLSGE